MEDRKEPPPEDLGLGRAVAQASRVRLLAQDGRFLVRRVGLGFFESWSAYHWLMELSWPRFLLMLAAGFLVVNLVFATGYVMLGSGALAIAGDDPLRAPFLQAFFFSVETLVTIGYGHVSPRGLGSNLLVTAEALGGMLTLALVAGMVFARFARPEARIRFTERAIIAPYRGGTALMFRMVNLRRGELLEVEARVNFSWRKPGHAGPEREFHELALERSSVTFFPLSWTVVHPITEASPLYGIGVEQLQQSGAEFYVYIKALDEGFVQAVHARTSYTADEVVFGVRFVNIIARGDDGAAEVDARRLDETEAAP